MGIKKNRQSTKFEKQQIIPASQPQPQPQLQSISDQAKKALPKIEHGLDESGNPTLIALFQRTEQSPYQFRLNLSYLLAVPNLAEPFAEALVAIIGPIPNAKSALDLAYTLRAGFFTFLAERGYINVKLFDFHEYLINQFISWLNQTNDGTAKWAERTRTTYYNVASRCTEWLKNSKKWKSQFKKNFSMLNRQWTGYSTRAKLSEIIDQDLMTRIRLACISEVEIVIEGLSQTKAALSKDYGGLQFFSELSVRQLSERLDLMLAYIALVSDSVLLPELEALPRNLQEAINEAGINYRRHITPKFYPTPRAMVPFVLLMALPTAYNPDTIRNAKLGDFKYAKIFGDFLLYDATEEENELVGKSGGLTESVEEDLHIRAYKKRSNARQPIYIPVDSALDNPAVLYELIKAWTETIRPYAPPLHSKKLFLFEPRRAQSKTPISSWAGGEQGLRQHLWDDALNRFRTDHQLEKFTLKMFRPTVVDVALEESNGDPRAAQIQANHRNVKTTTGSYISASERQRQAIRLGYVLELRDRWRQTKGFIDSRDRDKNEDLGCATPGWRCFDPYDSPYSAKGKMCSSYARCPICPLGHIDLASSLSCAYAFALLDAIHRAQTTMTPEDWIERLGPIKERLDNRWLPAFDKGAVEGAKIIYIPLMPKPE